MNKLGFDIIAEAGQVPHKELFRDKFVNDAQKMIRDIDYEIDRLQVAKHVLNMNIDELSTPRDEKAELESNFKRAQDHLYQAQDSNERLARENQVLKDKLSLKNKRKRK